MLDPNNLLTIEQPDKKHWHDSVFLEFGRNGQRVQCLLELRSFLYLTTLHGTELFSNLFSFFASFMACIINRDQWFLSRCLFTVFSNVV